MRTKDSWNSEFRKQQFYKNQEIKRTKQYMCHIKKTPIPKTIAVMLDLEGTCDFLDEKKAKLFLKQIEFLRKKFNAQYGTICISTHNSDSLKMQSVLELFAKNLPPKIKIGLNFFYGGTYDYKKKEEQRLEKNFNANKIETFEKYYITNCDVHNEWFAIVDDMSCETAYKKYQKNHPCFFPRPSKTPEDRIYNNFMSISTETFGFDGVLEAFHTYITRVKNLSKEQILEAQRTMITHGSSMELADKIQKRNFSFVERYFCEGHADAYDYNTAIKWLSMINLEQIPTQIEAVQLKKILEILSQKFQIEQESEYLNQAQKLLRKLNQPQ